MERYKEWAETQLEKARNYSRPRIQGQGNAWPYGQCAGDRSES